MEIGYVSNRFRQKKSNLLIKIKIYFGAVFPKSKSTGHGILLRIILKKATGIPDVGVQVI